MAFDAFISYSHAADGRLAPALQRAIQRLAKPWYRPRALRVFRDESALTANPHLWSSIQDALDDAEWFVLLASPDAAASEWVNRELAHWLSSKSADRILVVLTDGTLEWSGHELTGTAVPEGLRTAFTDEPRHVDLRWAATETDLDVRNSRFRDVVAQLAAPMHGVAKDELESEDIRQHRRARNLARGGVSALTLLVVVSLVTTTFALLERNRVQQRNRALTAQERLTERQRLAGVARQLISESSVTVSVGATDRAALLVAQAARFASRTGGLVSDDDVQTALINALQPNPSLDTSLTGLSGAIFGVAVSPDGSRAAAVAHGGRVGVWRLDDNQLLSTFAGPTGADHLVFMDADTLVVIGHNVVVSYRASGNGSVWTKEWSRSIPYAAVMTASRTNVFVDTLGSALLPGNAPSVVYVIDSRGRATATIHLPTLADTIAVAPDGRHFAVVDYGPSVANPTESFVDVYRLDGRRVARFPGPAGAQQLAAAPSLLRYSADGTKIALATSDPVDLHVFHLATGKVTDASVPADSAAQDVSGVSWSAVAISPTFDQVVEQHGGIGTGDPPIDHFGVATISTKSFVGDLVAPGVPNGLLQGTILQGAPTHAAFEPDRSRFVAAGEDSTIPVFALPEALHSHFARVTSEGTAGSASMAAPDGSLVVTAGATMRVTRLRGSGSHVDVPIGSHDNVASSLAFGSSPDAVAIVFSDGSLEVRSTLDGKRLLAMPPPAKCSGDCAIPPHVSFSGTVGDGRVAVSVLKTTRVSDLHNGVVAARHDVTTSDTAVSNLQLSTSGTRLATVTFDLSTGSDVVLTVHVYDATTRGWAERRSFPAVTDTINIPPCPCAAISPDARRLIESASTGLTMWNLDTGKTAWTAPAAPEGMMWFSADGSLIYHAVVTGDIDVISARDGTIRYSLQTVDPSQQMPLSFVDGHGHLLMMGTPEAPGASREELTDWALDTRDLVSAACREANRNLSRAEWKQYVGTFDRYERTCPDLPSGS